MSSPTTGKPAGVLVGFASEDDWLEYRIEHDARFLERITAARASIQAGLGVRLEDVTAALKDAGRGRRRARSAGRPKKTRPSP